MATIKDIARELGIDFSTVSLALRDHPRVAVATRQRVRDAAERVGYVPNRAAQALRLGTSRTIAFVLWGSSDDQLRGTCPDYILGGTSAAFAARYQLLLLLATEERLQETAIDRFPELRQTDGALFIGDPLDRPGLTALVRAGHPVVHLGDRSLADIVLPCVSADYAQGGELAAAHLLANGHQRLAVLARPHPDAPEISGRRIAGFAAVAGAALLEQIDVDGQTPMEPVLDRLRRLGITAVFTTETGVALRLLTCCQAANVAIPGDLSIVTFDDLPVAAVTTPPLTCIRQPRELAGQLGVELLRDMIEGRQPAETRVMLPCELVQRASVGPPRTDNR